MDNKATSDNISGNSNNKNTKFDTTFDCGQIKELTLPCYFPMTDQEMLYIMKRYTGLSKVRLVAFSAVSWPFPSMSKAVIVSFLEWAFKLENCYISPGGLSGETWLINLRHSFQGTVDTREGDAGKATCTLKLSEQGFDFIIDANFALKLEQRRGNDYFDPAVSSKLECALGDDTATVELKAKRSLIDLNDNIQKVTMKLKKADMEVGDYINSLLSTTRPNLTTIEAKEGRLLLYNNYNTVVSMSIVWSFVIPLLM